MRREQKVEKKVQSPSEFIEKEMKVAKSARVYGTSLIVDLWLER